MNPFSSFVSPMMTKVFAATVLIFITVIGLMYWQMSRLETKLTNQAETIGVQAQYMAQQTQTITDIENDKRQLNKQREASERALTENRKTNQELRKTDKLLRTEIDRLKYENSKINDYLDVVVSNDIIRLFRQSPQNSDCNQDSVCNASPSSNDANASTVYYTNESIVFYVLDLETALDSCNADKASLRLFFDDIKSLNNK